MFHKTNQFVIPAKLVPIVTDHGVNSNLYDAPQNILNAFLDGKIE